MIGAFVVAALVLAACAKSSSAGYGGGNTTPGSTSSTSGAASSVKIGSASASSVGTVLVNAKGFTLYHLATEKNGQIQCTGSCASTWPPVLLPSGTTSAVAGSGVTGKLGTVTRPDGGIQVTYDGLTLYTYSGDSAPGQASGQGIQGVWFAVGPSGSTGGATSGGSTGGGGGGGGGY